MLYNRALIDEQRFDLFGENQDQFNINGRKRRESVLVNLYLTVGIPPDDIHAGRRNSTVSIHRWKKWNDAVNIFPLFYLLHSTSNIAFALIKIFDPLNAVVASTFSVTLLLGLVTIGMLSGVSVYLDVYSKFLIGYAQLMSPSVRDRVKSQFTFALKYSKLLHLPVFVFGMFPMLSVLQKKQGGLDVQISAYVHFFGIGVVSIVLAYWIIIKALFTLIFEIEKYLETRQSIENEGDHAERTTKLFKNLVWKLRLASKVMCGAAFIEVISYFAFGFKEITVYSVYQIPIVQFAELLANGMMVFTVKNFSSKQERSRIYHHFNSNNNLNKNYQNEKVIKDNNHNDDDDEIDEEDSKRGSD